MQDVYKNIEEYNPGKKGKVLIVFNRIADMISNKKRNPVVIELFIRGTKLNMLLVFIMKSYFEVPNFTQYFIM